MKKPKKWTEVYPQGTKEGDEELKFFKSLARTKFEWRSTAALIKESGLSKQRVEEILKKYASTKPPIVYASPHKEDHWGYWERVPEMLPDDSSLSQVDQKKRINDEQSSSITYRDPGVAQNVPATTPTLQEWDTFFQQLKYGEIFGTQKQDAETQTQANRLDLPAPCFSI